MGKMWTLLVVCSAVAGMAVAALNLAEFQISAPRANSTVAGPRVVVSGYGDAGTVTVRVFRDGNRVFAGQVTVNNGRWLTVPLELSNGDYTAEAEQGTSVKTVAFSVGSSVGFGFVSPENGAAVSGPNIEFKGRADGGTVKLRVYKGDDLQFEKEIEVKDQAWTYSYRMADGNYRAVVERGTNSRTVSFRVGLVGLGDTARDTGPAFGIDLPRDGANLKGQSVTFKGKAAPGSVSIRLYDGDTVSYVGAADVVDGQWSLTHVMSVGVHTIVLQQGAMTKTTKFTVQPAATTVATKPADRVAIAAPRNNATVQGPRVKFSGTANTPSVGVYIYKGDTRVFDSSQKVEDGKWTFTTSLESGEYRVEITAGERHATLTVKVK